MKLRLLHKGLLLVSVPLCFEITIFGWLIHLQNELERTTELVNRNRKIAVSINQIIGDGVTIGMLLRKFNPTGLGSQGIAYHMVRISQRFDELKELTKQNPEDLAAVETCSAAMRAAQQVIRVTRQRIENADSDEAELIIQEARHKLDYDLDAVISTKLLQISERSLAAANDSESRRLRERIRLFLKGALVFSVIVALSGATLLGRNLAGRLSRIQENANRLAGGKELLPPIGGADEVSELDQRFHYAAELINAAKRMREEVTAMITHDLKTPLQSIRSFLEMMDHGVLGELNDQGKRLLSITEKESLRMRGLIEGVLQLERLRSGRLQLAIREIQLGDLLNKCADAVQLIANDKQITLKRELADSGTIDGDETWLEQAFLNILSNAIKFSPEKSQVAICTRQINGKVETSISDQGPGIPPEEQKLIFERFHRMKSTEQTEGSGLGLAITNELIALHHGSIQVESKIGSGSIFKILLPARRKRLVVEDSGENGENSTG